MRRLVCNGCGLAEDLDNPTGTIHLVRLEDLSSPYAELDTPGKGVARDRTVEEDLCKSCRDKLRREFFGVADGELLDMPLMKGA